ncbi:hypothetical protein V7S43_018763 [Phytophthora oleae]|uniref:PiggyBac transposable element-derived protein domain-containing protein n=1 Tax=Phytophthora oleae TaxID=2107226 RepID=A0ABD3EQF7_9STRA
MGVFMRDDSSLKRDYPGVVPTTVGERTAVQRRFVFSLHEVAAGLYATLFGKQCLLLALCTVHQ